jgi:PadR family transcriptional regulator, regulatory protein AphA
VSRRGVKLLGMSTRYVLLGLLDIMPMSGYDLARNLEISLQSLWAASYGQIYPTLHKLAEEGLIVGQESPTGRRERTLYTLTPAGHAAFQAWLQEPVVYPPFRDPFKLWASYLDVLPPDVLDAGIRRHIALHEARLAYFGSVARAIETGEHPLIRARAERLTPGALARLKATRAMIFRELSEQARAEIASAERIRAFAVQLSASEPTGV